MKFSLWSHSAWLILMSTHTVASCAQVPETSAIEVKTSKSAGNAISLLPADTLSSFKMGGPKAGDAQVTTVDAKTPDFERALRVRTMVPPPRPYDIQLASRNVEPIAKGDILLASFWARTIESPMQEGFIGFTFEQATPDFKRSFGYETSVGTTWKRFDFPFRAADDYAPGEAVMNLRLGYGPQIVEIAGISLLNYAKSVAKESLPATKLTYAGNEPNAAWRKAAQERIEKIRKGDLKISVRDRAGHPVSGAEITIRQTRQAFAFGSAVSAKGLISSDAADRKYQEMVKSQFNRIVFENDLKWDRWKADRETPQQALKWLREAGIEARGHVLVWPSWKHSPSQLQDMKGDPDAVRRAMAAHITDEVSALRGQLHDWDVLNEPYKNHDIIDLLGPSAQSEWFRAARRADPQARLYLNDYGILASGGNDRAHQKHFSDTIAFLQKEKAPIDGIGIQGHFGSDLTPPVRMLEILDDLSKFNLPIQITEFDVQVPSEALQADFTRDFLTAMFSHPAVNGVLMWGFWEGRHYAPDAALWKRDWTPKPNGQVWLDLVQKQWRTNLLAPSAADGTLQTRAFLGDYEIVVTKNGQRATQKVSLDKAGQMKTVEFKLP